MQWMDFEKQLRQMKWSPDMNAPMCRYSSPKGKMVDFLFPSSEVIQVDMGSSKGAGDGSTSLCQDVHWIEDTGPIQAVLS